MHSWKRPAKLLSQTLPYSTPTTKKTSVPPLTYKKIKEKTKEASFKERNLYHPHEITITPRSKIKVYLRESILEVKCANKKKIPAKSKKKSIAEIIEEPVQPVKLQRITSSKIAFPATTIGQIMMRVRELVIDPLKKELPMLIN
jgi:hypothetical protein